MNEFLVLNGPNLNMLGLREPTIYGHDTYDHMCKMIADEAEKLGVRVRFVQSNHEGALIDAIQQAWKDGCKGIVINPGGYTHTSVALHDSIASVPIPTIEVHISNVHKREEYRHHSMTVSACRGQIVGFGFKGYLMALRVLAEEAE